MEKLTAARWARLKSGLTRVVNRGRRFVEEEISSDTIDEAKEMLGQLKERYNMLSTAMDVEVRDGDDEAPDFDEEMDVELQRYSDMRADLVKKLKEAEDKLTAPVARAGQGDVKATREKKADRGLQPFVLTATHTPTEYRQWKVQFEQFYKSGNMNVEDIAVQRGRFSRFMDISLFNAISEDDVNSPIFGDGGLLDKLDREFAVLYPLFVRRMDLMKVKQGGEDPRNFLQRIQRLSLETEFESLDRKSFCVMVFAKAVDDRRLRRKLFQLKNPSYEEAMELVTSYLEAERSDKQAEAGTIAAFQPRPGKKGLPPNCCMRCGKLNHRSDKCKVLEKGLRCKNCQKKGHLAVVCQSRTENPSAPMRMFRPPPGSDASSSSSDECLEECIRPEVTPRLGVIINHRQGNFKFEIFPDSGGCFSMISSDLVKKHAIPKFFPTNLPDFQAVNGAKIRVDGCVQLKIRRDGDPESANVIVYAIISPDISREILLGYEALRNLEVIPPSFPMAKFSATDNATAIAIDTLKNKLCTEFKDVIRDSLPAKPMKGPPMHIQLKENAIPYKITTARKTPRHWQQAADTIVNELLRKNVLARVDHPTEWTAPGFWVPKSDGKGIRLVVDFSKLNKHICRPVHLFPSPLEIISGINHDAKYFAKLDAISGFYQIGLDEESSHLTTFLIPQGRFRWLRCPMGSSSSSDEWCRRSDDAVRGICGVSKLVDDVLVVSNSIEQLEERLMKVLTKCREAGIALSRRKFEIGESIQFAGYTLSADGVRPDDKKLAAIAKFPTPTDVSKLRSFLGLANQLIHFVPDLASVTSPLRELLKKDVAFTWLEDQDRVFNDTKAKLTKSLSLQTFDPNLPTYLVTDASRLHGLGFALIQSRQGPKFPERLIQCGSRCLSSCERNYATVELECLAMAWGMAKCDFFLRGMPHFSIVTDHRPLLGIFEKSLGDIANPRIARIREKMMPYNFKVVWLEGKSNVIADALSRNPVERAQTFPIRAYVLASSELTKRLKEDANTCPEYLAIVEAWRNGKDVNNLPPDHAARTLKDVWKTISLLDDSLLAIENRKLLIPRRSRQEILRILHEGHCGISKTVATARKRYFWPGMRNDIVNLINKCDLCQQFRPGLRNDNIIPTTASYPMERVAVDLFQHRNIHYLVMVDRYSGYPLIKKLVSLTGNKIIEQLKRWFWRYGFPRSLRSDGGPQFRAPFSAFCEGHGIKHERSSPYNHQSNGLAEVTIRSLKGLLSKVEGQNFEKAFACWRNSDRKDKPSPNSMFFGRDLRQYMPELSTWFPTTDPPHDKATDKLRPLKVNDPIWMQSTSGNWPNKGTIVSVDARGRTYLIELEDGRTFIRNRKFLKRRYV